MYHFLVGFPSTVSLQVDYSAIYFQRRHVREFWDPSNNNLYGTTFLHHLYSFWLKKIKSSKKRSLD